MHFEQRIQQHTSQELHPIAPTLHKMKGIEPWLQQIRRFIANSPTKETDISGKKTRPHKAIIIYSGLPGSGKFTNATSHGIELIQDPEDASSLSHPIPIPHDIHFGYIDWAWALFSARHKNQIPSLNGQMSTREEQDIVSNNMIQSIGNWLTANEENIAVLIMETVAVSYPLLNQGATPIKWLIAYAKDHPEVQVFECFLRGEQIQQQASGRRRKIAQATNPQEANTLYASEGLILDKPFISSEEVLIANFSYAHQSGIEQTTQVVNDLAFAYAGPILHITRRDFEKKSRVRDAAIELYYDHLARDEFGLYTANMFTGVNKPLRRKNTVPANFRFAFDHIIIPNFPLDNK
jgi:hypothetical protein